MAPRVPQPPKAPIARPLALWRVALTPYRTPRAAATDGSGRPHNFRSKTQNKAVQRKRYQKKKTKQRKRKNRIEKEQKHTHKSRRTMKEKSINNQIIK